MKPVLFFSEAVCQAKPTAVPVLRLAVKSTSSTGSGPPSVPASAKANTCPAAGRVARSSVATVVLAVAVVVVLFSERK